MPQVNYPNSTAYEEKQLLWSLAMLFILGLSGCGNENIPLDEATAKMEKSPIQLAQSTRSAAEGLKPFMFGLSKTAILHSIATSTGDNAAVSPVSQSILLAMLANGIDMEARENLLHEMGVDALASLNDLGQVLMSQLPLADAQTKVSLANSFWANGDMSLTVSEAYGQLLGSVFSADVFTESFRTDNAGTLKKINDWCIAKTPGFSGKWLEALRADNAAIALNALSYKARWQDKWFDAADTEKKDFHGTVLTAPVYMMQGKFCTYVHCDDEGSCMVTLPFGNGAYSLHLLLPASDIDIADYVKALTPESYESYKTGSKLCAVNLELPRFDINSKSDMNEILGAMGLKVARTEVALDMFNVSGIRGVIEMNQKVLFSVDEEGADVSVVSEAGMTLTSNINGEPMHIQFNRPFVFFIEEYSTGVTIVSGLVRQL